MSGATVVLVAGSFATAGMPSLLPSIRARGLGVAVLTSRSPSPPVQRFAAAADRYAAVDNPYDPRQVADAAVELAEGRPAAVLSWHDGTLVAAARAAELLGVPGSAWAPVARSRNKYAARRALRRAGLPEPGFALMGGPADAASVVARVGLPAVVKPVSGTASSLVRRVTSEAELRAAYENGVSRLPLLLGDMYRHLVPDPDTGAAVDQTRTLLVEGMLSGTEYCADVVVRGGAVEHLLLLENFLLTDQFFGRGFAMAPRGAPPERLAPVWQAVDDAVAALGIDNMPAHIEIIDDVSRGPTVVEVNAGRGGGLLLGWLIEATTGVDLREEYLSLTLGTPPPPRRAKRMPPPLANLAFFPPESGRIVDVHGLDRVADHPDVVLVRPPDAQEARSDDYEASPVNVIVFGLDTRDELVAAYDEIAAMIDWAIEPLVAG